MYEEYCCSKNIGLIIKVSVVLNSVKGWYWRFESFWEILLEVMLSLKNGCLSLVVDFLEVVVLDFIEEI